MTPSGSVAGHLTDLVSGEVRWARARVPASPATTTTPHRDTQSGQSGSRQLSGPAWDCEGQQRVSGELEERRAPLYAGPARLQTGGPEVAVLEPVNLLSVRLPSQ